MDKVSSAFSPKKRSHAPKERKDLHAADLSETQDSEAEEWTDTESLADV